MENVQPCVFIIMVSEYFRRPDNPQHSTNSSLFTSAPGNHSPPLCLHGSACSGRFPAVESQPVCPSVSATPPEHRFSGSVHVERQGVPPSHGRVLSDCLAICHLADPSPVDGGAVFSLWLVWVVLLGALLHAFCLNICLNSLGCIPGSVLLGHDEFVLRNKQGDFSAQRF